MLKKTKNRHLVHYHCALVSLMAPSQLAIKKGPSSEILLHISNLVSLNSIKRRACGYSAGALVSL
ncbi:hypothetical protein BDV12DRAFT_174547 [Aspergillus spectabilis]